MAMKPLSICTILLDFTVFICYPFFMTESLGRGKHRLLGADDGKG